MESTASLPKLYWTAIGLVNELKGTSYTHCKDFLEMLAVKTTI